MSAGLQLSNIVLFVAILCAMSCCDAAECVFNSANKTVIFDPEGDGPHSILYPPTRGSVSHSHHVALLGHGWWRGTDVRIECDTRKGKNKK